MTFKDFLLNKNVNLLDVVNLYFEIEQIKFDLEELKTDNSFSDNSAEIDYLESELIKLKYKFDDYAFLFIEYDSSLSWDKFDEMLYNIYVDLLEEHREKEVE